VKLELELEFSLTSVGLPSCQICGLLCIICCDCIRTLEEQNIYTVHN